MYCYLKNRHGETWSVGFHDPKGRWQVDSTYPSLEDAAARVHWLNGGGATVPSDQAMRERAMEIAAAYDAGYTAGYMAGQRPEHP